MKHMEIDIMESLFQQYILGQGQAHNSYSLLSSPSKSVSS